MFDKLTSPAVMQCSYEGAVLLCGDDNRPTDSILNVEKVSIHVWTKKKQAVGKLTVEVAKLITSPPLLRITKWETRSSVMAPRPDGSSGRSGEFQIECSRQSDSLNCPAGEALVWRIACSTEY
jgi:hypothetical protein